MEERLQGLYLKCVHRKRCAVPCRPVELHLAQNNLTLFEKHFPGDKGGAPATWGLGKRPLKCGLA